MSKIQIILVSSLVMLCNCQADEVTDTVDDAMVSYKNGDFSKASEDLGFALDLLKQKKGESLKVFLPEPLSGWTAEEAKSQTVGAAMFGGGTTLSRKYLKGNSSISIEIITDSPMMQSVSAMLTNPMFASSNDTEMIRINREKGILKFTKEDKSGELTFLAGNKFMIMVKGQDGIEKDDLLNYAKAIDVEKLKTLK
jgi:hypothetical protein